MNFFNELKRRNVIRVGIAYVVVAWLILQFADVVLNNIAAPGWVFQVIMLVLAIGFPLGLVFAWAFEMTPDGLKKEKDINRGQSITAKSGRKLDFAIFGIMAIALAYFVWESRFQLKGSEPFSEQFTGQKGSEPFSEQSTGQTTNVEEKRALTPFAEKDKSIAVLPFANRSNSEDDAFFTDGIHDDLLTQLAKISDLKVISRTSMMKYKNTEKTIPEIAAELGVSTILEGGIQRAGKRIRINAQLIDVNTDEHLWAETFDREMTVENVFDIQSEITRQIVTAVKGQLTESEQKTLSAAPTENLEAYEAYLHARAATNRADYSSEKYVAAQPWAEQAVNLDPAFAEAWALLTEIHAHLVWLGYDTTPERRLASRKALDTALQLKPESPAVKAAQGDYFYRFDNDYEAALTAYSEAQGMAPADATILEKKAMTQRRLNLWDESVRTIEDAMQLDPASAYVATVLIDTLTLMNEWDRVESLLGELVLKFPNSRDLQGQQVLARISGQGDLPGARVLFDLLRPWEGYVYINAATELLSYEGNFEELLALLDTPAFRRRNQFGDETVLKKGTIFHLMGDKERARQYLQQQVDFSLARTPDGTLLDAFNQKYLAASWSYLGEHEKALESSRKAMELMPMEHDSLYGAMMTRNHTFVLARAGKRDEALERLTKTLDKIGGYTRWELNLDPQWDFFRDDERFNELVRPLNFKEDSQ